LDQPDFFKRLLARPLAKGEPEAAELLKVGGVAYCNLDLGLILIVLAHI